MLSVELFFQAETASGIDNRQFFHGVVGLNDHVVGSRVGEEADVERFAHLANTEVTVKEIGDGSVEDLTVVYVVGVVVVDNGNQTAVFVDEIVGEGIVDLICKTIVVVFIYREFLSSMIKSWILVEGPKTLSLKRPLTEPERWREEGS